jgi:putative ABC transport system permease protein
VIGHLFRLVWNRRRRNGLLLVEILASFLLLCGLFTLVAASFVHWAKPLGFDWRNVWVISVDSGPYHLLSEERKRETRNGVLEIERALAEEPDVVACGATGNCPYSGRRWLTTTYVHGNEAEVLWTPVGLGSRDVLRWQVTAGRWFEEGDEALEVAPILITQDFAQVHFGSESPLGKRLPSFDEDGTPKEPGEDELRTIIGVIDKIRPSGEHREAEYAQLELYDPENPDGSPPPRQLLVRVQPGATAALEERLLDTARRLAPEWEFTLDRMADMRADRLRDALLPLAVMGLIAGFLILMVGLGLIGVLWQSVVRRRSEIGLRRAMGATGAGVRAQILGELVALTTLAVGLGTVIYLQFPLLGILNQGWVVVGLALGAALAVMYGFVLVCGLYPSWLATRVEPARALMYE